MSYNNFSKVVSDSGELDEDFISPMSSQGEVIVNGIIASGTVISAMHGNGYYPLPSGSSREMVGRTRRAAVAYRLIDDNDHLDGVSNANSDSTVAAITCLNGAGRPNDTPATLLSRIEPIGIVQQETELNGDRRFNIHIGGQYTMINNSNRDIVAGDWLMIYAPSLTEMKQGGRGKMHDENGYVELWLVPYHPSIHKAQPAQMYACLTQLCASDSTHTSLDGKAYLPAYEEMCEHIMDSFMDVGITFIEYLRYLGALNRITLLATDEDRAKFYANLLGMLGHSQFFTKTGMDRNARQECLNAFFLERLSTSKNNEAYKKANFFPGDDPASRKMRQCQLDGVSLGMTEQASFNFDTTKNIMGKAVTSAAPKKNYQIQLTSYACK